MRFFSAVAAALTALATIALTQVALAADMPVKARMVAPAAIAPSWTGFYFGGDIGGAWMRGQNYTFDDLGGAAWNTCGPCGFYYDTASLNSGRASGILGGLHLGYNWQFSPAWVFGAEADFLGTSLKGSATGVLSENPAFPVVNPNGLSFETKVRWLASLRGRLGWLATPTWLIYATGGVAFANVKKSANATCPAGVGLCVFTTELSGAPLSVNKTRAGFVVGGGAEWEFAAHWRGRLEYLYYGFNTTDSGSTPFLATGGGPLACLGPTAANCNAQYSFGRFNIQTVRVGLSYAF